MADRNSNNYKIAIVAEANYGAQNKVVTNVGGAVYFDDKLEWNNDPITVERARKKNSLYKAEDRMKITGTKVSGTLSGDLTDLHEILLQAHFDDTASPYLYAVTLPTTKSYNVYQLYLDGTGACTHYDVLVGCVFNPLTITGEANGIIQYSCTIDAADYSQDVANSSGEAITLTSGIPITGVPFLFGDVTASTGLSHTAINSFSLELSKTMVDNALRYQNSLTKTNDKYTQVGGTFSYAAIWDTSSNSQDQGYRYNETAIQSTISLVSSAATWQIDLNGVISEATRPDADRGLFIGNYTFDLTSEVTGTFPPVSITVS